MFKVFSRNNVSSLFVQMSLIAISSSYYGLSKLFKNELKMNSFRNQNIKRKLQVLHEILLKERANFGFFLKSFHLFLNIHLSFLETLLKCAFQCDLQLPLRFRSSIMAKPVSFVELFSFGHKKHRRWSNLVKVVVAWLGCWFWNTS